MDRTGADFYYCVKTIVDLLGATPAVMQLPIGKEGDFLGVVDLVQMKAILWDDSVPMGAKFDVTDIPDVMATDGETNLIKQAEEYHEKLVELAVEQDEELLMGYLEGEMPTDEQMVRESSDDEPFSALAFKIMTDPFVGTLTFTRLYSGVLDKGSSVLNSVKGKRERIGRMLEMNANDRTDIEQARAGDIVALVGCKETTTGETLCDPNNPVILEKMDFPEPVIKVSVEPKTKADQDKMTNALIKLAAQDP